MRRKPMTWQRRHDAVLRYTVERPAARNAEIAEATGYSVWHISRIMRSPEFDRRYRAAADTVLLDATRRLLGGP